MTWGGEGGRERWVSFSVVPAAGAVFLRKEGGREGGKEDVP